MHRARRPTPERLSDGQIRALAIYDRDYANVKVLRELGPDRARAGYAAARRSPTAVDLVLLVDGVPVVLGPEGLTFKRGAHDVR